MEHLNQWPPVLLRRWLFQAIAGLACLLIGVVVFLAAGDKVLLLISVLLALFTVLRCMSFYQLITNGNYEAVEGVCVRIKNAPLRKRRSISFLREDGVEQTILLDKQTKVRIGNCYRAYFRQVPDSPACPAQDSFLALEDLGEYQAGKGQE